MTYTNSEPGATRVDHLHQHVAEARTAIFASFRPRVAALKVTCEIEPILEIPWDDVLSEEVVA